MAIIPGSTCVIKTNIKDIDITLIESAIFSFSVSVDEKPIVQKKYLTKGTSNVKYIDGNFIVPLTQQDTLLFDGNKNILYETQINFEDKSVSKTIYTKIQIRKTLATELIGGNAPNVKQNENYYEMKADTVLYLNVSTEQIKNYVSQANTFAENAKTSMENAKNSEEAAQSYSENAKWSSSMAATAANDASVARTSVENKISVANTLQNKAIEAATTAQQAKDTVLNIEEQVSADKTIVEDAKGEVISAKNETLLAKNEAVTAKEYVDNAKNEAVEASNDAISAATTSTQMATQAEQAKETVVGSIDNANTLLNNALDAADVIARQKAEIDQIAEQITADKADIEQSVTTVSTAKQDTITAKNEALTAKNDAISAKNDAIIAKDTVEGEITTLKEDVGNIKKKKNVVIYVGSAELSDEQKLSCDYVCDGIDDQLEINQAIDSLPDSGGEIHLSRGIFNISNTIYIRKRIKLVGEGKGITLDRNNVNNGGTTLLSELTGGCIIQIGKSYTLSDIKGITLSDFQIVGAGINVESNYCNGINVTTYTDCVTLERLAICHCFYGLFVDQSATVDDISVTNCDFQRDSCGIYIYGQGWQTRIENNIFWDMSGRQETSGIVLSAGKNIVNGNYFGVSSLVYQGMACAWISAKNAVFLLCNGNSFSRCTSSPIRFKAGGQFASISGNSFYEIGKAQFNHNERAVLYVDGAGTGGGRISFTNNTVYWANDDDWKTSYLAYLTNQVAQVNISNNTVIDGIGKINENELVYKSEDSAWAITIGNNVLC